MESPIVEESSQGEVFRAIDWLRPNAGMVAPAWHNRALKVYVKWLIDYSIPERKRKRKFNAHFIDQMHKELIPPNMDLEYMPFLPWTCNLSFTLFQLYFLSEYVHVF